MKKFIAILSVICILGISSAHARELIVNPRNTGLDEYATINAAINAAIPNDVIIVLPGTYNESVIINKNVSLKGSGPDVTVINAGSGNGIKVQANAKIEAFTIQASNNGIYVEYKISPIISNVLIY